MTDLGPIKMTNIDNGDEMIFSPEITLYRGEEMPTTAKAGIAFSPHKEVAEWYAGKKGNVIELKLTREEFDKLPFLDIPVAEGVKRVIYYVPQDIYRRALIPKAEATPVKLYRTTRGFAEDAALRTDLETKQGYKLFASFNTPKAMQEAASRLAGQDLKFVKHISTAETGNWPTWEIYAKPAIPKKPEAKLPVKAKTVVDYDRQYSLEQLREMCRKKGLSASGDKKTLVRRLLG